MSFTGDLEHLPIVDILQLLHATRKSGILKVSSRKGESQLVFKDGYIVSANHLNSSIRIGDILLKRGAITPEMLEQSLREQQASGNGRKPLIVILLEKGVLGEEEAYRALEELIEFTLVEILTWKRGTFLLDVLSETVVDGYRYYPAKMNREISVDTQGILMDSLRIFDEKLRDGELPVDDEEGGAEYPVKGESGPVISAEILGLADLDLMEPRLRPSFSELVEHDPATVHRVKLGETAAALPPEKREELVAFLTRFPPPDNEDQVLRDGSIIFFGPDETLHHAVSTVCKHAGIPVFATDDQQNLDPIILQSLSKNSPPLLVIDAPDRDHAPFSADALAALRRHYRTRYPSIPVIQLAPAGNGQFTLDAYADGVRAVLPGPPRDLADETYVAGMIRFLRIFQSCMGECFADRKRTVVGSLRETSADLREARELPDVALAVLRFVALIFQRAVILISRDGELIAERGIGIQPDQERPVTSPAGIRIPLAGAPLLRRVIDTGAMHFGRGIDIAMKERLHGKIGAPHHPPFLLFPLRLRGKTIALVYGDFGTGEMAPVEIDLLEILANQAELALENAAFRKRLEKTPASG